jgi:hypothetical protein
MRESSWKPLPSLTAIRHNVIHIPRVRLVQQVLVAIDFLLVEGPIRQFTGISPHRHSRRNMYELEMTALALDGFTVVCIHNVELEQRIVVSRHVFALWPCSEFLVCWHQRRCNIVGEKIRVGLLVKELDNVLVPNYSTTPRTWNLVCRNDVPFVVLVGVMVSGDLLACNTRISLRYSWGGCVTPTLATDTAVIILQRILVRMRVQENFGILVLDGDCIVISQFWQASHHYQR